MSTYDDIYGEDDARLRGESRGWIQWKGTDVCMDIRCECGNHSHVDADFLYHWRCPDCKKAYAIGQTVALIEITDEQGKEMAHGWPDIPTGSTSD